MKKTVNISFNFEQQPPNNPNAEKAVLSGLMQYDRLKDELMDKLFEELFYQLPNQCLFRAIEGLYKSEKSVDLISVNAQLKKNGEFAAAGGMSALLDIMQSVDNPAHIETHIGQLTELWVRRQLIINAYEIQAKAYDPTTEIVEVVDEQIERQNHIENQFLAPSEVEIGALADQTLTEILKELKGEVFNSCPVGLVKVDKHINHEAGDTVVIAARPAMGKTAFMLFCALSQAKQGIPVLVISLEMSNQKLMRRMIAQVAGVNLKKYDEDRRAGKDVNAQTIALNEATQVIKGLPIYFCEKPSMTLGEILAQTKKMHTRKGIQSLFVDYLQLVSGLEKQGNREQQVATVSRELKKIAQRLSLRVTALSQLSRSMKGQEGKRPVLTDLRESGAIEQDASIVLMLHRPAYYGQTVNEDSKPVNHLDCEVIIAKNREGDMNLIAHVKFNYGIGHFTDYEETFEPQDRFEAGTKRIFRKLTAEEQPEQDGVPF